ncbi:MAG: T9SS type A sorting domain-containing protein [Ignavibacteria bacterium]|jgi:photosystem II stability/assembly factor-like uncharacterized protein|nr:T9SS type A sorting domain-containing protein [Ignavibacteria bacterium]
MRKKNIICFLLFLTLNSSLFIFNSFAQWVQQSVPVSSGIFWDMKFVNANTGFIAHSTNVLLKTTDAGYNWTVNKNGRMTSLSIVDSMCFYGAGYNNQYGKLYKTTNGGQSWDSLLSSYGYSFGKTYFFNRDTGLISGGDTFDGFIWRTIDGGQTKQLMATVGATGIFHFLKEKVNGEYYGWMYYGGGTNYRTTNSGLNWTEMPLIPTFNSVNCLFYLNKDTGWVTVSSNQSYVFYTTNGGLNWSTQGLPSNFTTFDVYFSNPRKGWIGGSWGSVYATTNGGNLWGLQSNTNAGGKLFFLDSLIGWSGSGNHLSHTTNGGGTILSINNNLISSSINYILKQNYPNPFNSSTIISYHLSKSGSVNIKVYDISGKEVATIVNKNQIAGKYEITFNAGELPSGIYFYALSINKEKIQVKKMIISK